MDEKQQHTLQNIIIDYFEKYDDKTFSQIIDSFVYHKQAKTEGISIIIDEFLKTNRLTDSYVNYVSDFVVKKNQYLRIASGSDITMVENVKAAMINAAYNRFRNLVYLRDTNKRIAKEHKELLKMIDQLMDAGSTERYHEAIDDIREFYDQKYIYKRNEN